MSAATLDAAQSIAPANGTSSQGVAATAAAAARKGRGPMVGFEALLAILNAAQGEAAGSTAKDATATATKTSVATKDGVTAVEKSNDDAAAKDAKSEPSDTAQAVAGAGNSALILSVPQITPTALALPAQTSAPAGGSSATVLPGQDDPAKSAALITASASKADALRTVGTSTQDVDAAGEGPKPASPGGLEVAIAPSAELGSATGTDPLETAKRPIPAAVSPPSAAPATPPATPSANTQTAATDTTVPTAAAMSPSTGVDPTVSAQAAEQGKPSVTPSAAPGARDRTTIAKSPRIDGVRTAAAAGAAASAGGAISAKMAQAVQSQAETDLTVAGPAPDSADPAVLDAETESPSNTGASVAENTASGQAATTPATIIHAEAAPVRALPQTVATLAAQIVKKLDGRSSHFDVALDPVGLGHVNVRVVIGASGKMSAALAFDTPQAAAELRGRAGELHAALEKAGFDLSGGLTFDVAGDRGQGQGAAGQDGRTAAGFRGQAFQSALDTVSDVAANSSLAFNRSPASGVDIRI